MKTSPPSKPLNHSSIASKLAFGAPLGLLVLFALMSYPMMYPGFDIWVHLVSIEYGTRGDRFWYELWSFVFTNLALEDPFAQAKFIHAVQVTLAGSLVFSASLLILKLLDKQYQASPTLTNFLAWFAVFIWMVMQGTVSAPHFNPTNVWYAWSLWYSVNYQIALPFFIFTVACLLYGLVSTPEGLGRLGRWPYLISAAIGSIGVAVIHAAEVPYVAYGILLIAIIWFRWSLRQQYLLVLLLLVALLSVGLHYSHVLPQGLVTYQEGGLSALVEAIIEKGHLMTREGYNRGNASWNYWYSVNAMLATVLTAITMSNVKTLGVTINWRIPAFVVLSAAPAAALQIDYIAGFLPMITLTGHAWRFTFSSFLFVAPSLMLMTIALTYPRFARMTSQAALAILLVAMVLTASKLTEKNWVSYQYARSLALTLSPENMWFGLSPKQESWLDQTHQRLLANPPEQPICTDMFTGYYLFFVKEYKHLNLNNAVAHYADLPIECSFPQDGGDILGFSTGQPPWDFDLDMPPWWKN